MGRQESSMGDAEREKADEGGVVCGSGLLFVLYHVSARTTSRLLAPSVDIDIGYGRLLFMTYNGWVMLAVTVGAFVGYMVWGGGSSTKSVACH